MDHCKHTLISFGRHSDFVKKGRIEKKLFTAMELATEIRASGLTASPAQFNSHVSNLNSAYRGYGFAFSEDECWVLRFLDDCELCIHCSGSFNHSLACHEFCATFKIGP